ncbi:NUDIX hydrolase [Phycicoccus sp. MAQZ13P-2]|uniref:NUDIX domain-containing protein n=1 Tax=Phycicoccus mangrovi TaxID=2840470 RepID=UPI001C006A68|nr:NUDIX hydrolase [Phycicoccus mangrovi]MBT9254382.1 NUDIX hydrolase [Phycicoccus mangrovi]MBT9272760.1 NUDIX hydrolase [Phycicoccus mangrovi]
MWPVTASRTVYANPWIEVVEDDVVRPDGEPGLYGVVRLRRPAVFVVALTEADEVVLVTVDRHTTGPSVEVPAGGCEEPDPRDAARRELAEETGLRAEHWREVGRMDALNGICVAPEVVYLATGLSPVDGAGGAVAEVDEQEAEGISAVRTVPWPEVMAMVGDGRIRDGETVAALMFAALALGRVG